MSWYFPDVSSWEPDADIPAILKRSHGVVGIRAGFGSLKDKYFDRWRDQARGARVLVIYHFPTKTGRHALSVEENARQFARWIGKRRPNEVYVLDVEPASGKWSRAECERYMQLVRDAVGGPPLMIYANESYAIEQGLRALFTTSRGWVARYGPRGEATRAPSVPWLVWQFTDGTYGDPRPSWPGAGRCDTNRVAVMPDEFARRVLGKGAPAVPPKVVAPSGDPVLRVHSRGAQVEQLQRALNAAGAVPKLVIDGDFGSRTEKALRAFQKAHKLTIDGVYGPKSAAALKAVL